MKKIIDQILFESWPWYIGGPLIGLLAIALLIFERKTLGVSISFEQIWALINSSKETFKELYEKSWQIWFVIGIIFGGLLIHLGGAETEFIAIADTTKATLTNLGISDFSGYVPIELFNFDFPQILILLLGGLLIGFGSRFAGGCTAGHSIMGVAQLAPASIIATIGFFIGGLISTHFILPSLLAL